MMLWNIRSNFYDAARKVFPFNIIYRHETDCLRILLTKVKPTQLPILDIGTGTGSVLNFLPKTTLNVAADLSPKMLARAKIRRDCSFVNCAGQKLAFVSQTFGLVTAIGLLEYVLNPELLLLELARVTTPGGYIVLTYSPKCLLNSARTLLGHKLGLQIAGKVEEMISTMGLLVKSQAKTLIQVQLLLQKDYHS